MKAMSAQRSPNPTNGGFCDCFTAIPMNVILTGNGPSVSLMQETLHLYIKLTRKRTAFLTICIICFEKKHRKFFSKWSISGLSDPKYFMKILKNEMEFNDFVHLALN